MGKPRRLFEIDRCGDPCNRHGWAVREFEHSFDDRFCTYRGDLSPVHGRDNAIRLLRRLYPGCVVRVAA